jgi:hypothetical protein
VFLLRCDSKPSTCNRAGLPVKTEILTGFHSKEFAPVKPEQLCEIKFNSFAEIWDDSTGFAVATMFIHITFKRNLSQAFLWNLDIKAFLEAFRVHQLESYGAII